ncbi:Lrp/AsnC family transcriptional regulator [Halosegnis marinus]|uniref:Lrp/AsnC family transcriptional regulator n=1 Tax=Halosegnis marinus TaxID=3034023 RepID=A0ABD5ZL55_9EURY|nr:Lrp/AsnC ligand binding domain-containing protein [Halosegnis sp. DT85]
MVKAHTGDADRLRDEVAAVEGVESVHIVAGDVDLIAKVRVESPAEVREIAATTVRNLDGVEDTHTYVAME